MHFLCILGGGAEVHDTIEVGESKFNKQLWIITIPKTGYLRGLLWLIVSEMHSLKNIVDTGKVPSSVGCITSWVGGGTCVSLCICILSLSFKVTRI